MTKLLGFGIVWLVVIPVVFFGNTASASTRPQQIRRSVPVSSPASDRTFSEISGCLATGKTLLTSIVVDESASLRTTDPSALRVAAIETAVDALADLRASAPSKLSVQVSLSTFARGFSTLAPWQELTDQNAAKLRAVARGQLPTRDNGNATDYREALVGARHQLDQKANATGAKSTCKLLLWFTDGALDVDAQTATAANQLCRKQGIVDSVRSDGISVLALALFTRGGLATQKQRNQLRAIAEGSAAGTTCGTFPIPEGSKSGAYLAANDAAALSRLFAGAGALISGASKGSSNSCPGTNCPSSRFSINVDPGVGGFRVVAQIQGSGRKARLSTPSGNVTLPTKNGTTQIKTSEGTVQTTTRSGLTTISVTLDKVASKSSAWTLDLGGEAGIVDLYWVWGAKLEVSSPTVIAGQDSMINGKLTDTDGGKLPLGAYKSLDVAGRVGSQTTKASVSEDGTFTASVPAGDQSVMTTVPVSVTVRAITKKSGTGLGPLTSTRNVVTTLPPSFPTITPKEIDLGTLTGTATGTATLHVVGSNKSDSTVCLAGATFESPKGSTIKSSTPNGKCVSVKASQAKDLRVVFAPSNSVDGLAQGAMRVKVKSQVNGQSLDVAIPVRFDLTRPVDEGKRWTLVALLVALALLLPLLILLVSDWLFNRFTITPVHQVAAIPVLVTADGIRRRDEAPSLFTSRDLVNVTETRIRRVRSYHFDSVPGVLKARGLWNVIRGSKAYIGAPSGSLVVGGTRPYGTDDCRTASVQFGEVDTWFLITNDDISPHSPIEGTLVAFVAEQSLSDLNGSIGTTSWDTLYNLLIDAAKEGARDQAKKSPSAPATSGQTPEDLPTELPDWMKTSASNPTGATTTDVPIWLDEDLDAPSAPNSVKAKAKWSHRRRRDDEPSPQDPPEPLPEIDFLK